MSLIADKLNVQEAAEFVGCSVSFIRNRINDGRLPCVRVGNRAYLNKADLESLITQDEQPKMEL